MHPEAMIATLKSLKLFGMAHDCRDAGGIYAEVRPHGWGR